MAWDDAKEQELKAIEEELKGLGPPPAKGEVAARTREQLKDVSPLRAGLEMTFGPERHFGLGSAADENRTVGQRVEDTAMNAAGMVGADVGGQIGSSIGGAAGGLVPGPLNVPSRVIGRKGGEYIGRIGGAWGAGYAAQLAKTAADRWDSDEDLDTWWHQVHENAKTEGQEQATGEGLSIPIGGAIRVGGRVLKGLGDAKIDKNASAISAWMHDNFKRSYQLASDKVREEMIRDPAMAERMIANQGLTRSEKLNNRLYDLMNGIASGSWWGGGRMRKASEARDDLFRLTARQFGEDVGEKIDPADLADLLTTHAQKDVSVQWPLKKPLLAALEAKSGGAVVSTKKFPWHEGGREFDFMHKWDGSDNITVRQYRQLRDGNDKLAKDFREKPEIRALAEENIRRLDRRAARSLPPDGVTALKDVLAWEKNYNKTYGNKFIEGILSDSKNARSFVDGLVNKPDYRKFEKIFAAIEDEDVKNSLRRALLDRTLDRAMLPSGEMTGDLLRKTVDATVGRKPLNRILGPQMAKDVDRFVKAREYLQSIAKRGEAGRVATSLTQAGAIGAGVTAAWYGHLAPAAATTTAVLVLPRVAAQFLTGPGGGAYARFIQAVGNPRVPRGKVKRLAKQTLGFVVDHKIAERIAGRMVTGEPLDAEETAALQEVAGQGAKPSAPMPPPVPESPPTGAFVEGPPQ